MFYKGIGHLSYMDDAIYFILFYLYIEIPL